jgi:hypothetical protein
VISYLRALTLGERLVVVVVVAGLACFCWMLVELFRSWA